MARGGATHISVDVMVVQQIHVLPPFWARRSCRHGFQCGLVHTQQRPCRDFAMWTLNGGPFGCQVCPLLLIHDAPVAPFFVASVLPLRLSGDFAFDIFGSCLVCFICALVGEQRRARRELRIQMDEGFWAGGICLLPVSVSRAGECQVHEEIGSSSNSSSSSSSRSSSSSSLSGV